MNDLPSLEPALATMRLLASQASGGNATSPTAPGAGVAGGSAEGRAEGPVAAGGFAAELRSSILRINEFQTDAVAKGRAFQAGDPSVTLNDLMIDIQKASVAFEFGKAVRDRLVTAYKEVMRMQV